jgi:hypothetical protein
MCDYEFCGLREAMALYTRRSTCCCKEEGKEVGSIVVAGSHTSKKDLLILSAGTDRWSFPVERTKRDERGGEAREKSGLSSKAERFFMRA